jgi:hypothetical protein
MEWGRFSAQSNRVLALLDNITVYDRVGGSFELL